MRRMYVTEIDERVSPISYTYFWGIMTGYFYPDIVFESSLRLCVVTDAEKYDGFKKLIDDRLVCDRKAFSFDILGGQYEE